MKTVRKNVWILRAFPYRPLSARVFTSMGLSSDESSGAVLRLYLLFLKSLTKSRRTWRNAKPIAITKAPTTAMTKISIGTDGPGAMSLIVFPPVIKETGARVEVVLVEFVAHKLPRVAKTTTNINFLCKGGVGSGG